MMKMNINIFTVAVLSALLLFSCGSGDKKDVEHEPIDEGKITVLVDEAIAPMMEQPFAIYRENKPDVELTTKVVDAREAIARLLAGKAKTVIVARGYMKDEDSLMKEFEVKHHPRKKFAQDALVFFAPKYFPLDTLNTQIVKKLLTVKGTKLKDFFPELDKEPELVINNNYSSEFANLLMLAAENEPIEKPLKMFSTPDSVIEYVRANENALGIGLLSQIVNDDFFKPLRMGYTDTTGAYVKATKPVHQAYIVMGQYPYIVNEYVYLFQDLRNVAYWFAEYITKENEVVKYYKDYGIAPTYARFKLIKRD